MQLPPGVEGVGGCSRDAWRGSKYAEGASEDVTLFSTRELSMYMYMYIFGEGLPKLVAL